LRDVSEENNKAELGTTRLMMVNKIEDWFFSGYSDNFKTIVVKTSPSSTQKSFADAQDDSAKKPHVQLGDFVKVRITHTESLKLFAEIV
jgi:tRNA A37 methylthiotransferase MiaB